MYQQLFYVKTITLNKMEIFFKKQKLSFSTAIAMGSFSIGTILFASYMILTNDMILIIGLFYFYGAVFVNLLVSLNLLYRLLTQTNKEDTLIKLLILLSNIPIAYFYFMIVANKFSSLQLF